MKYQFNGQTFNDASSLFKAVKKAKGFFKLPETAKDFEALGITAIPDDIDALEQQRLSELKAQIRATRNELLRETDFVTACSDVSFTPEQVSEVEAYRAALRNITDQRGFPESVEWPVKPNFLESKSD